MPKKTKVPTETRPSIPMPIKVQESEELGPLAVSFGRRVLAVVSIDECARPCYRLAARYS